MTKQHSVKSKSQLIRVLCSQNFLALLIYIGIGVFSTWWILQRVIITNLALFIEVNLAEAALAFLSFIFVRKKRWFVYIIFSIAIGGPFLLAEIISDYIPVAMSVIYYGISFSILELSSKIYHKIKRKKSGNSLYKKNTATELEKLNRRLPFSIVLPSFLPQNYDDLDLVNWSSSRNKIFGIDIIYTDTCEAKYLIWIKESDKPIYWEKSNHNKVVLQETIQGTLVKIEEEDHDIETNQTNSPKFYEGSWNKNGIYFILRVVMQNKDQFMMVLKSMI
jgi:hypothetical protein